MCCPTKSLATTITNQNKGMCQRGSMETRHKPKETVAVDLHIIGQEKYRDLTKPITERDIAKRIHSKISSDTQFEIPLTLTSLIQNITSLLNIIPNVCDGKTVEYSSHDCTVKMRSCKKFKCFKTLFLMKNIHP